MKRTVEHLDGLALGGIVEIGSIRGETPGVLWSSLPAEGARSDGSAALQLRDSREAPLGEREVILSGPAGELRLRFPVPAPEISGVGSFAHESSPGIWIIRWPLSGDDRERMLRARPDFIALQNGRTLLAEGEPFVKAVREIRSLAGARPLLWVPRVALPHRLALLAYLGVDLVDTTEGLLQAANSVYLDPIFGPLAGAPESRRDRCRCPACSATPPGSLADHTLQLFSEELDRVRSAIRDGRLRDLVEARLAAEPLNSEILRYADRLLSESLEERAPVASPRRRTYVLDEAHRRPEVRRFHDRVLTRYRPPLSKKVLLLVPCSRTKPYRNSPSHRRFARALEGLAHRERVHVVSVSSPLGLVPKELEDVYPARHYDIPVTGDWSAVERSVVQRSLDHLLRSGSYEHLVVHLNTEEYAFLADGLSGQPSTVWTMERGSATSPDAIHRLREAVGGAVKDAISVPGGPLAVVREELAAVASFQFGSHAAELLFAPPIRLAGRPWFQRLVDGNRTDLATWRDERGLFQLTMAGGVRVIPAHTLEVEISAEVNLLGDLFVPGVRQADVQIRVGDACLVTRERELVAVGEAALPGRLMTELSSGLAVRIRHRAKSRPAISPPTVP